MLCIREINMKKKMRTETNKTLPKGWKIFYLLLLIVYAFSLYMLLKNDLDFFIPVLVIFLFLSENSYKRITNSRDVKWFDLFYFKARK